VSTWLSGETTGGSVGSELNDARVEPLLGHFRAVATFDGRDYVGGWIVLEDGRQRGAITLGGTVVDNPTLDSSTGVAESSLGTFGSNCFINPHTGERICRYLN